MTTTTLPSAKPPFYRDTKVIGIILQVVFALAVLLFGWLLYSNMIAELSRINNSAGSPLTWNFLGQTAGFEISEGPVFRAEESYFRAFLVGFVNTLRVSLAGIVLATLLGVLVGIARVSNNWLLSKIAHVYIDIFRTTPLLVQLLFWYFGVVAALPDIKEAIRSRGTWLSLQPRHLFDLALPEPDGRTMAVVAAGRFGRRGGGRVAAPADARTQWAAGQRFSAGAARLPSCGSFRLSVCAELRLGCRIRSPMSCDAATAAHCTWIATTTSSMTQGSTPRWPMCRSHCSTPTDSRWPRSTPMATATSAFLTCRPEGASLTWETPPPVVVSEPLRQGFNFRGGLSLTPEFAALLLGLVIYTGAFIAEIVRAGINAVPKGQWEASRAVGLPHGARPCA